MSSPRSLSPAGVFAALSAALTLALPAALPAALSMLAEPAAAAVVSPHSLFQSRELWATIDVCNASDEPDTVGIRGSMPGDGAPRDTMYMRFRLQYRDATSKRWVDLAHGADSGFVSIGAAKTARQAGRNFQLVPVAGKPASTLRGVVSFQWRQGVRIVHSVSRVTSAGHQSLAGADPANFSSATCVIG